MLKGASSALFFACGSIQLRNSSDARSYAARRQSARISTSLSPSREVAEDIGPGLARAALAGKVDGELVDTAYVIDADAALAIVTAKDDDGLEVIRHSTAHLLAQAVKQLFPEAQVTIGPVIEDGFYYDFAYERAFTPEDLEKIEKRMDEIAAQDLPVRARSPGRDEAVGIFASMGEEYKAEIIASIPEGEEIGLYGQGDFEGPVPRPARAQHRAAEGLQADQAGRRLLARRFRQRNAAADLRHGLGRQEGAQGLSASPRRGREARPSPVRQAAGSVPYPAGSARHGVLARQGLAALPRGRKLHARAKLARARLPGSASTPQILDRSLWEKSGHWDKYAREHVHDGLRRPPVCDQAHELPGPRADL